MDQDTTQVNNTAENAQPNQPVESQPVVNTEAPVNSAGSTPPAKKTGKLMFLIIGAVLVLAIILLVMIFSGALNKSAKPVSTPQTQQIITPTPGDQDQGVSQTPITNQQDVTNALGELDKANPDTVGADLGQNDQDASAFSQ